MKMELIAVSNVRIPEVQMEKRTSSDKFIISANAETMSFDNLREGCIIPVFAKDNESTISHSEFISAVGETVLHCLPRESILEPAIKVSHPIKGRVPEAMGKPVEQLLESDKTVYFERMAFMMEVPTIYDTIDGNHLSLSIGGVRAYNHENLYGKKTEEHFKVFIGFKNRVCINLCISTDGFKSEIRARTIPELMEQVYKLISGFDVKRDLQHMKQFPDFSITENQFAQLVGKARMYPYLPKGIKEEIPELQLGDSQVNLVVRDYYKSKSFCRNMDGDIDLWKLYNLFTGANKSSYIDTFLDRNVNAHSFVGQVKDSLEHKTEFWYFN